MRNAVRRAYRLLDGAPVEVKTQEGRRWLVLERPMPDPMGTVIVVEIAGDGVALKMRFSLVVPAYNEERYLPRLLDSVDAARGAYRAARRRSR